MSNDATGSRASAASELPGPLGTVLGDVRHHELSNETKRAIRDATWRAYDLVGQELNQYGIDLKRYHGVQARVSIQMSRADQRLADLGRRNQNLKRKIDEAATDPPPNPASKMVKRGARQALELSVEYAMVTQQNLEAQKYFETLDGEMEAKYPGFKATPRKTEREVGQYPEKELRAVELAAAAAAP